MLSWLLWCSQVSLFFYHLERPAPSGTFLFGIYLEFWIMFCTRPCFCAMHSLHKAPATAAQDWPFFDLWEVGDYAGIAEKFHTSRIRKWQERACYLWTSASALWTQSLQVVTDSLLKMDGSSLVNSFKARKAGFQKVAACRVSCTDEAQLVCTFGLGYVTLDKLAN